MCCDPSWSCRRLSILGVPDCPLFSSKGEKKVLLEIVISVSGRENRRNRQIHSDQDRTAIVLLRPSPDASRLAPRYCSACPCQSGQAHLKTLYSSVRTRPPNASSLHTTLFLSHRILDGSHFTQSHNPLPAAPKHVHLLGRHTSTKTPKSLLRCYLYTPLLSCH